MMVNNSLIQWSIVTITVNPRISLPGSLFIFDAFWVGLIQGESLFEGELIKSFDICRIKNSSSKLLFSIIVQEQSKFKH